MLLESFWHLAHTIVDGCVREGVVRLRMRRIVEMRLTCRSGWDPQCRQGFRVQQQQFHRSATQIQPHSGQWRLKLSSFRSRIHCQRRVAKCCRTNIFATPWELRKTDPPSRAVQVRGLSTQELKGNIKYDTKQRSRVQESLHTTNFASNLDVPEERTPLRPRRSVGVHQHGWAAPEQEE